MSFHPPPPLNKNNPHSLPHCFLFQSTLRVSYQKNALCWLTNSCHFPPPNPPKKMSSFPPQLTAATASPGQRLDNLGEKSLGCFGYGNIGSKESVLAEALGMKVLFYDTETKLPLGNATAAKNMKEVLNHADIVSLHVPETPQTKLLINKNAIKQMKPGAILINYARGEVVDLKALATALEEKHISGAAIDVFPWEPEKNGDHFESPMQGLKNVLLTPHIGGSTEEAQQNIGEDVSIKLF